MAMRRHEDSLRAGTYGVATAAADGKVRAHAEGPPLPRLLHVGKGNDETAYERINGHCHNRPRLERL